MELNNKMIYLQILAAEIAKKKKATLK